MNLIGSFPNQDYWLNAIYSRVVNESQHRTGLVDWAGRNRNTRGGSFAEVDEDTTAYDVGRDLRCDQDRPEERPPGPGPA